MRTLLKVLFFVSISALPAYALEVGSVTEETSATVENFPASFFAKFAPRTARDMLDQVPGFVPLELDEARGLGQATSNVLINGARASGKQDSALTALERVPARAVTRILIIDGAKSGVPGLSGDVANVIIDDSVTRGTWLWRTHQRSRIDPVWFRFDFSLSGRKDALLWAVNLQNKEDRFGNWGPERVYNGDGLLLERRDEFGSYNFDRPGGSVRLNWSPDSGAIANLSLSYTQVRKDVDESSRREPVPDGDLVFRYLDNDEKRWLSELSADYEFDVASGRLKLIAYQRFEHSPLVNQTVTQSAADIELNKQVFLRDSDTGESILRGEYRWQTANQHSWQLAVEGAYNFVDADSSISISENGGALMLEPLENGSSKVEERRIETMLTYDRSFGELNVQLSLGGEFSQLEQTGSAGLSRDFTRPKGFVSLSKPLSKSRLLSLKLAREVGQLDFFDFLSSVDVDVENAADGNPELVPPQTWLADLRLEQQMGELGNVSLRFWYEKGDDIVDYIPLANGGEAVGNLDSATRYGGQWLSTTYLDRAGLAGGQLTLDLSLQKSRLEDPLTGQQRRLNHDLIREFFAELRQDVPGTDWAWGLSYWRDARSDTVRENEVHHTAITKGEVRAFVEQKNVYGLKASLLVRNLIDAHDEFRRTVFDGTRLGQVELVEDRSRPFGLIFEFKLEGSF